MKQIKYRTSLLLRRAGAEMLSENRSYVGSQQIEYQWRVGEIMKIFATNEREVI